MNIVESSLNCLHNGEDTLGEASLIVVETWTHLFGPTLILLSLLVAIFSISSVKH